MPITPIVAADVKTRFPQFNAVADALIDLIIAEAYTAVGDHWCAPDQALGQFFFVAHVLTLEGEPARSNAAAAAAGGATPPTTPGSIKRLKIGDVEVEYDSGNAGSSNTSGGTAATDAYASTPYGLRYLELLKKNVVGARIL